MNQIAGQYQVLKGALKQLTRAASDLHGAGSLEAFMAMTVDLCAQNHQREIAALRA